MGMRYLPMTEADKEAMLADIGITSTEELFADIPEEVRLKGNYQLERALTEHELMKELKEISEKNLSLNEMNSFLGAGVYHHFIPAVVNHIISRSEFYTAYTPYQPEISQGELQAIFEFQTMIAELTGMDVANSSLYDGGTALGEAVNMAHGETKRSKILLSKTVHPEYREVIKTYGKGFNLKIVEIDMKNGQTNVEQLKQKLDEETAAVVVQHPNFFGQIEPLVDINNLIQNNDKTMFITSSNPLALGYLTPPGELGADIVVGDTQVFGIPAQFGGPHCGYFATKQKFMRKIPGRLVGQTVDEEGTRGYVLTLQTREQHIRRDQATSNICSNQALYALASSVAMTAFGKEGIKEMAYQNMQKARYLKSQLEQSFSVPFTGPLFNEFVIKMNRSIKEVNELLIKKSIIGGLDLSIIDKTLENHMLIAVTEIKTKEEMDEFVKELRDIDDE